MAVPPNAKNDRADKLDGQSHAVGKFHAHVGLALHNAVGGEKASAAACRASGTTVNSQQSKLEAQS
eukprot:4420325-Pleurochrysis_carterae.AAC.1